MRGVLADGPIAGGGAAPGDGQHVAFQSYATDLAPGTDANDTQVTADAVRQAMIGQKVKSPSGYEVVMGANHHMAKPVMIGEIQADGQFNIVYKTPDAVPAENWSRFIPENANRRRDTPSVDSATSSLRRAISGSSRFATKDRVAPSTVERSR